ncbi:MAG TPA: SIS domain-containing protein [Kiritimatiellia bacterium]|nr:SIS domain-containing protein [Kiritimatiellia bacterium]HRZ11938.1 SIS domain-containing protein [Kiritimatiellia bacterium]HSA17256.1 SIS domain-containing protein [Kiritimatiellia bacterium]
MNWDRMAEDLLAVVEEVIGGLRGPVEELASEIAARLRAGGKVLACGNGGSAADAQHLAGELMNRFLKERRPYAGIALSTDTSVLTSIANDYSFAEVFEKQVRALGRRGDVLIAISTSGNAENVCRAVKAAKDLGLLTVGLTGGSGGKLRPLVDRPLCVASTAATPRIQEGHQLIIHALCERLEELLES